MGKSLPLFSLLSCSLVYCDIKVESLTPPLSHFLPESYSFFQCWSKPTTMTSTSWSKPTTEKPSWEEPWKPPSSSSKDGKSSKSKSSKSTTTSSKSSKSKGGYQPCKYDWDCPSGSGCHQVNIPKWYPGYDIDEKEDGWKSWAASTTDWKSATSTTAGSVSTIVILLNLYVYDSEVVTHHLFLLLRK